MSDDSQISAISEIDKNRWLNMSQYILQFHLKMFKS